MLNDEFVAGLVSLGPALICRGLMHSLRSSACAVPPGGVRGMTYPPLLRYVPRRGYNAIYVVHLRVLQATAGRKKLRNSHLALALGNSFSVQFATTLTLKI